MIKFGSVCSGIEAASVAWHPIGWKAAWLSEIEAFPSAVLAHHYPDVPNLGDMTTLPDRILSGEVEAPDVFCGGTPCQAFSVAGKRESLDDARGNLSLTFCEIANAIDNVRSARGEQSSIIFWENVPGVLNTKDNAFGCFLGALSGEAEALEPPGGKWTNAGCVSGPQRTIAWRILDAQYFGVAQRRRRVFVVASARADFDPTKVLFESEGLRRDIAPSREAGEGSSQGPRPSATFSCGGIGAYSADSASATLLKSGQDLGNGCEALVAQTFDFQSSGEYGTAQVAATLAARDYKSAKDLAVMPINTMVALRHEALGERTGFGVGKPDDPAYTLTKGHSHAVYASMAVRRLTPVECERLQGFPDGYTNIPWRKAAEAPDSHRYKALGNSWAVPVVRWIGERIQDQIK